MALLSSFLQHLIILGIPFSSHIFFQGYGVIAFLLRCHSLLELCFVPNISLGCQIRVHIMSRMVGRDGRGDKGRGSISSGKFIILCLHWIGWLW